MLVAKVTLGGSITLKSMIGFGAARRASTKQKNRILSACFSSNGMTNDPAGKDKPFSKADAKGNNAENVARRTTISNSPYASLRRPRDLRYLVK